VSRTALVVDDSPTMRKLVAAVMTEMGLEVREAGDGQEALRALEDTSVQLIITDLNMPVMDGLTFIRQVRTRPGHRFTPILMLTTEGSDVMKDQGKSAGATGWLVKPFNPQQLTKVVGKVLP